MITLLFTISFSCKRRLTPPRCAHRFQTNRIGPANWRSERCPRSFSFFCLSCVLLPPTHKSPPVRLREPTSS